MFSISCDGFGLQPGIKETLKADLSADLCTLKHTSLSAVTFTRRVSVAGATNLKGNAFHYLINDNIAVHVTCVRNEQCLCYLYLYFVDL